LGRGERRRFHRFVHGRYNRRQEGGCCRKKKMIYPYKGDAWMESGVIRGVTFMVLGAHAEKHGRKKEKIILFQKASEQPGGGTFSPASTGKPEITVRVECGGPGGRTPGKKIVTSGREVHNLEGQDWRDD